MQSGKIRLGYIGWINFVYFLALRKHWNFNSINVKSKSGTFDRQYQREKIRYKKDWKVIRQY